MHLLRFNTNHKAHLAKDFLMGMVIQKEDIWIFLLDDGHGGYTSEDKVVFYIHLISSVYVRKREFNI